VKTLRLKRQEDDVETQREVLRGLTELDVKIGDEFTVASRASYDVASLEQNDAVCGKKDASYWASVRVWPTTGTARRRVVDILKDGPLTRAQLYAQTGLNPNTVRPRVLEAIDGGWIQQAQGRGTVDGNELLELTPKARREIGAEMPPAAPPEPLAMFDEEPTYRPPPPPEAA
jgi:hypothetical protein